MILNVSENDYANFAHNFSNALKAAGVCSFDICLASHPFRYVTQSKLVTRFDMVNYIKSADMVIVHHSHPQLFELAKNNCKGKVIVTHTGTRYREGHQALDVLFKDTLALTDQTEFFSINPNLKYIVSPVDFELAPLYEDGLVKIGHYPSNPDVKGTSKIIEMMSDFKEKVDFRFSLKRVDHYFQLERMAKCDVYIELFKPELNGRPYGCFGVTALEAAAMGKIVITNNLHQNVYRDAYGKCPMTIANTEWAFKNIISTLTTLSRQLIRMTQRETYEIMRENHSFEATGKRILKLIE